MIFITIGTTVPFDRLVLAVENIAGRYPDQFIAQISSTLLPVKNMQRVGYLSPTEYYKIFDQASLIVSHAGMGTILSALERGKRIVVMPRRMALAEHHSEHQLSTASTLSNLNYVRVAHTQDELEKHILDAAAGNWQISERINQFASDQLLTSIKDVLATLF